MYLCYTLYFIQITQDTFGPTVGPTLLLPFLASAAFRAYLSTATTLTSMYSYLLTVLY